MCEDKEMEISLALESYNIVDFLALPQYKLRDFFHLQAGHRLKEKLPMKVPVESRIKASPKISFL